MAEPKKKRIERKKRPEPVVVLKKTSTGAAEPRVRKPREEPAGGEGLASAKFIGGPRNEHGTRVARRVTCSRCGTSDHVPYVPKDPGKALCRNCAVEVLKMYEAGVKVRMPTKPTVCNLCGTPFNLPITADDDGDPLCPNCLRGFTTWQGSVDVPFSERTETVVEERLSGALVRKRKPK